MLLSQAIENIDQEISQLYAQVAAHKDHQSTLIELDAKADDLLEHLGELVAKVKYHAPDEIALCVPPFSTYLMETITTITLTINPLTQHQKQLSYPKLLLSISLV